MPPTREENELLDPKIEKLPTCCKFENLKFSKKLMNFQNTTIYATKKSNIQICMANQIIEFFEKNDEFSKHHYIHEKKKRQLLEPYI